MENIAYWFDISFEKFNLKRYICYLQVDVKWTEDVNQIMSFAAEILDLWYLIENLMCWLVYDIFINV